MMPMGFEYGFKKRLNVVRTRPQDWETPTYDLTPFIKSVNRMKKTCPVFMEEGPQVRVNPATEAVTLLLKSRESRKGRVLAVINPTPEPQAVTIPDLSKLLGKSARAWQDLTPDTIPLKLLPALSFTLLPSRMKIFYNPEGTPLPKAENTETTF
jgi:starch synthase (maltosyl-transferring)